MSCKRTKAMKVKSEIDAKKLKITEASLTAQKMVNKLIKEHRDILLFTSQTDDSNPVVREFLQIKRHRTLQ